MVISDTIKKPVLILHVGTMKTGTTALQVFFAKNQEFFMKNKICYSNFFSNSSHLNLYCGIIKEYFEKNEMPLDIPTPLLDRYSQSPQDIINGMKQVFYENNCNKLIISCEHFLASERSHAALPKDKNLKFGRINYIKKYFKESFEEFDIKVVCYLRRRDDFIESMYNNHLKGYEIKFTKKNEKFKIKDTNTSSNIFLTGIIDRFAFSSKENKNEYENLSEWADIYGKENIIVRTYEKSQLSKGIEYDFCTNILGIDSNLIENLEFSNANSSIKKDIIEYKIGTKLLELRNEFTILNEVPSLDYLNKNNKKNILTAKQADEILDSCKEEYEKIAREYLGREDGVLFYDKRREEKDDYPGLSLQASLDISSELIRLIKNNEQANSKKTDIRIKTLETTLSSANDHIKSLEIDLSTANKRIEFLDTKLNSADKLILSLQSAREISNKYVKSLENDLNNRNNRINSLEEELNFSNNHVKSLKLDVENASSHINYLQTKINSIYQSQSWKITKPMRDIKRLFVRLINRS